MLANGRLWRMSAGIALLLAPSSLASTIHVPADFPTIQFAINAASNGDVVLVEQGTYFERISFEGKAITVRASGSNCNTTIDGTGGIPFLSVVTFDNGEGPNSVLEGFTITGGNYGLGAGMLVQESSPTILDCRFEGNVAGGTVRGNPSFSPHQPGIGIDFGVTGGPMIGNGGSGSGMVSGFIPGGMGIGGGAFNNGQFGTTSPTYRRCEFIDNTAGTGGGMASFTADATLIECTFTNNQAAQGGGFHNSANSDAVVRRCLFENNSSTGLGGGMQNFNGDPVIRNCRFEGNHANSLGGGLFHAFGSPQIAGCLFTGNTSVNGGGLAVSNGSGTTTVVNCTFSLNNASAFFNPGGGIYTLSTSLLIRNSVLWADTPDEIAGTGAATVTFSDVLGGFPGQGNLNVNPQFVDPAAGSFRLQAGSPCIGEGNNSLVPGGLNADLGGIPRILGTVDMGAYECLIDPCTGECVEVLIDCNDNGIPDSCDIESGTSSDCNGNFVPDECEGQATADVIFIIDGSGSIDPATFTLQKEGIIECICGPDAILPADGSTSVAVIQFTDVECEDVPFTLIDSSATATELCNTIAALPQVEGPTNLTPALDLAEEIFRNQGNGVLRQIFVQTDGGVSDPAESLLACQSLGNQLGVKICTALVGEGCPQDDELLIDCANAGTRPESTRPIGSYRCIPAMAPEVFGGLCVDCLGSACSADIDGNGVVDVLDLLAVLSQWGPCPAPPNCCPADIDFSGVVGTGDLLLVLGQWGVCPGSTSSGVGIGDPPALSDVMDCFDEFSTQASLLEDCIESKRSP